MVQQHNGTPHGQIYEELRSLTSHGVTNIINDFG